MGKWISVKDELPPVGKRVLVCRELRIECLDKPILMHDIGSLECNEPHGRWRLSSQQFSVLPVEPTVSSGIISYWMELPKIPDA